MPSLSLVFMRHVLSTIPGLVINHSMHHTPLYMIACLVIEGENILAIVEPALWCDVHGPPRPQAGLYGLELVGGHHPQVRRVVVPAAAAACAEQAGGGGGGVTVLPLHHPTPHCRGTITAGLWGGGCRDPHLGVHHLFILVLHCVLVVVAGAGVVALLEVPGVQEHLHPLLPGQDHALTHQDAWK